MLTGKVVFVTGGTGSFGPKSVEAVLERYEPERRIMAVRRVFAGSGHPRRRLKARAYDGGQPGAGHPEGTPVRAFRSARDRAMRSGTRS